MKNPLVIALIGLIVALFFSMFIFPIIKSPLNLSEDPDKYSELGFNIYTGNGYKYTNSSGESIDKAPVYPYLLAIIYYISGGLNLKVVQFIRALFHSLTSFVIFLFVRKIINYNIAVLAQFIVAIHPILIWYTARIWVESVYVFSFYSYLYFLYKII